MRRKYIEVDGWRIGTEIRMIKCGKKNCQCATNNEHRHPYYVGTKTDTLSGKTIKHYFKELPTSVELANENSRVRLELRLQELNATMKELQLMNEIMREVLDGLGVK